MILVIQTNDTLRDLQEEAGISELLRSVDASISSGPLDIDEKRYHYYAVNAPESIGLLIEKLMQYPQVTAAFIKPAGELPDL